MTGLAGYPIAMRISNGHLGVNLPALPVEESPELLHSRGHGLGQIVVLDRIILESEEFRAHLLVSAPTPNPRPMPSPASLRWLF